MIASVSVRVRRWASDVLWLGLLVACLMVQHASASDCPGHPDALGTSRTLVVDPRAHPRIGSMQYAETLPLEDHEVVLTFDDGPLPRYSNKVLEILAAQCVKATFFLVGQQAQANPEGVRKVRDAGHTVATHTQNHPTGMRRLPVERVRQELDDGIASVTAALGDGSTPVPFFRIPGLSRADGIEQYAASQGIQIWSADFPADDWRHVSSARVYDLALQRLQANGRGILLLHDIQPRTVVALPLILHQLKVRGYRIVHVVPATADRPATPSEPQQWQLHPTSETVAISRWPKIPNFVFAATETLPAPWLSDSYWNDSARLAGPSDRTSRRRRGIPLPQQTPWPRSSQLATIDSDATLPVPAQTIFDIPETARVLLLSAVHPAKPTADDQPATADPVRPILADVGKTTRPIQRNASGGHSAAKHLVPARKPARSVRVAGLKKR